MGETETTGYKEEAHNLLVRARRREDAREAVRKPIDYKRMKTLYPKQKAALTRAINSGDAGKVVIACAKAVKEWDEIGCWPDDWSNWQRALNDFFPVFQAPRLEDLA